MSDEPKVVSIETHFETFVEWPGEGPGGKHVSKTIVAAEAEALSLENRGYGGDNRPIRIYKLTRERIR